MATLCLQRMIRVCFVLLFFTGCFTSRAQVNPPMGSSPWKFANPTPIGYSFTDMSFIDNNTGLAVSSGGLGSSGAIMRTTDGGRNWQGVPYKYVTSTNSVSIASFNDVQFVTSSIAYAVGSGGLMVKSSDGGMNWSPVTTPLTALGRNINGLHFINKDTGYIGGAAIRTTNTTSIDDAPKVYFTRNGGTTWDSLTTPFRRQQNNATLSGFNQSEIQRIHFVNDSVGYVSGSCGNVSANYSAILWKIEKNIVRDYSLHRSKFGITATTGSYAPATNTLKGLVGVNDSLVLVSTLNNNIVLRVRTGKNDSTASAVPAVWGAYEPGVYEILIWLNSTATPFPANLAGNVAGQMQQLKKGPGGKIFLSCGASILSSTDNGTSWSFTKPHPNTVVYGHWGFNAMDVTSNGRIVVGTFNGLTYDSLPGSPSWQTVYQNKKPLFFGYADMDWADACNGIVVGSSGAILKTSDAGRTWVDNSSTVFEAAQISLASVQYHAVNSMFFLAGNAIYKSADQGTTNDAIFTEPVVNSSIYAFTMVGQNRAYAVAYRFSPAVQRTLIFRSLNANASGPVWDTVKTFPTGTLAPQLRNIKFANQDTGYTCGSRGKVYRTTDGGATWTDVSPDTTVNSNGTATYTALSVVTGKIVYVGGNGRRIFKSTDAGATWTDLTIAIPAPPTPITSFTSVGNIIMNDANNGYLHAGNIVMKTTDGWATWTYDLAPGGFANIALYPKIAGPIDNKKLYGMPLTAGSPVNSTNTAFLIEYGNAAAYNASSTETITNATCTNPNGGSITINATGGISPYTYSINSGPFQSTNSFSGLSQGAKTIVIKDNGCQTITKTITVGFTDNLTLNTNNDTLVCAGAPVHLLATANGTGPVYSWSPAGGLSANNISNPVAIVNTNTAYTVTASLNGCVKTKTVNIGIKANPAISAGPDKTIVEGDEVQLTGSGILNPVSVAWTPTTSIIAGANAYQAMVKPNTTTTYTLTVKNSDNCTSTDNVLVTVIPYCIKVMDAFTPNGDGLNDRWLVTNGAPCSKEIKVAVYNRYGNVIYTNNNYSNDWDGTYNSKPVTDGTYYYTVTFRTITGKLLTLKGNVTILR
ncbi:MAG: gliding motility-associated C-terminal domain-containing protein [Chitinophagaceae bacterium]|nr:gliding motility-associated C-terminal domain-containing protein [Chitinophagaceae bacterium]